MLLARTQTKRNRSATATPRLGRSLADLLPHDETRENSWWDNGTTSSQGLGVWDTHRTGMTGRRELIVVAPPDADQELSRWVWFDPDAHLPPLAAYLLEAAVLRYHARVLDDWHSTPRLTDLNDLVMEVAATFEQPKLSDSRPALLRSYLDRLQTNEVHLVTLNERLQRIVDQTGAALRQMPKSWGDPGLMIPNDRALAGWLLDQASAEQAYQRSRLTRITHTRQLVADELDRSSRAASDATAIGISNRSLAPTPADVSRKVFVVHGRDTRVKQIFFSFLQALDLRPQDWELLVNATGGTSPNIVDVVRRAPEIAQATIVLMTPDDTVQLQPDLSSDQDPGHETAAGYQARPNVLLELGMALMAYPERTIVVEIGSLRPIGDLGGLNVIRFDGSGQAIAKVISRLRKAGCPVDDSDTTWKDPSRFAGLDAFTRGPHEIH
jgi:predicted nucleotide-binding protein